jgi:dTDP-glucose 4,6-dehydratase/UDP-glucuronate decarboxylase
MHPIETMDANTIGTRRLLDYAAKRKIKSMLFMSTSEIYGDPFPEYIPTSEDYRGNVSCTGPRACYDESKRFGETLCVNFFRTRGVPVKIARPFNFYGPGLRLEDKRVIPDFFTNAFTGEDIVMHSDGKATRSFCYASDGIDGLLKILLSDQDGESFNVGNDREEISMRTLAEEVAGLFSNGMGVKFEASEDREYLTDNPQRRCPNLGKIRTKLGYEPEVMLHEGLGRTKRWYEDNMGDSRVSS